LTRAFIAAAPGVTVTFGGLGTNLPSCGPPSPSRIS
jgi:hypothetical protein